MMRRALLALLCSALTLPASAALLCPAVSGGSLTTDTTMSWGGTAWVSGSITVPAGLAIGIGSWVSTTGTTGSTSTIATSVADSFTLIGATTTTPPSWAYGTTAWRATTTAGARTFTLDESTNAVYLWALNVLSCTGHNTTTPITGFITNVDADGDGAASLTLPVAPTVDDIVIAIVDGAASGSGTHSVTPSATRTWSEYLDVPYFNATDGWKVLQIMQSTGSTSTDVAWTDLHVGTAPPGSATLMTFIVKAAAAVPGGVTGKQDGASISFGFGF